MKRLFLLNLLALLMLISPLQAQWTEPVPMEPQLGIGARAPWISNDNLRLYACTSHDLWIIERTHPDSAWGTWHTLPSHIMNTGTQRSPCESPTGDTLYFMSAPRSDIPSYGGYDIYFSIRVDTGWGPVFNAGPLVNSDRNELSVGISRDGSTLLVASTRGGFIEPKLFWHEKQSDGTWGPANYFPPEINDINWGQQHASLYPGNQIILFYRDSAVLGDIWESTRIDTQWQLAQRMPEPVNGPGMTRDEDPCISSDGRTLWFMKDDGDYHFQLVYSVDTTISDVGLYPHPADRIEPSLSAYGDVSQGIILQLTGISQTVVRKVILFDLLGREVANYSVEFLGDLDGSRGRLTMPELPSGTYMITINLSERVLGTQVTVVR